MIPSSWQVNTISFPCEREIYRYIYICSKKQGWTHLSLTGKMGVKQRLYPPLLKAGKNPDWSTMFVGQMLFLEVGKLRARAGNSIGSSHRIDHPGCFWRNLDLRKQMGKKTIPPSKRVFKRKRRKNRRKKQQRGKTTLCNKSCWTNLVEPGNLCQLHKLQITLTTHQRLHYRYPILFHYDKNSFPKTPAPPKKIQ